MNYSDIQIEKRYNDIPEEYKKIIDSPETTQKITDLGKKHGLLINQIGELVDIIVLIILGLESSADFIKNVMKRLEISRSLAEEITKDINQEIFSDIKLLLRQKEDESIKNNESTVSSIEKAGDFNIVQAPDNLPVEPVNVTSADRGKILDNLENPPKNPYHNFTEPLVDYLLSNPVAETETKVSPNSNSSTSTNVGKDNINKMNEFIKEPVKPINTEDKKTPPPRQGPDPYRELIR